MEYLVNRPVQSSRLNELFAATWPSFEEEDFRELLDESLVHVEAYQDDMLVGFVRIVQAGLIRGLVLGPTVHPDHQNQGVGTALLDKAAEAAKEAGIESLHVEFHARHRNFYLKAGFLPTGAGVRRL